MKYQPDTAVCERVGANKLAEWQLPPTKLNEVLATSGEPKWECQSCGWKGEHPAFTLEQDFIAADPQDIATWVDVECCPICAGDVQYIGTFDDTDEFPF